MDLLPRFRTGIPVLHIHRSHRIGTAGDYAMTTTESITPAIVFFWIWPHCEHRYEVWAAFTVSKREPPARARNSDHSFR